MSWLSSSAWHTGLSGGAPDSVRCPRHASGELPTLGNRRSRTTIIHRTVRWCIRLSGESSAANLSLSGKGTGRRRTIRWRTGLSDEPTVAIANGRSHNLWATRGLLQLSAGAPDYPVCTVQCPVR
jgi:hypothetical protein